MCGNKIYERWGEKIVNTYKIKKWLLPIYLTCAVDEFFRVYNQCLSLKETFFINDKRIQTKVKDEEKKIDLPDTVYIVFATFFELERKKYHMEHPEDYFVMIICEPFDIPDFF